jgi:hypothetical protein
MSLEVTKSLPRPVPHHRQLLQPSRIAYNPRRIKDQTEDVDPEHSLPQFVILHFSPNAGIV